jgi:hypothetical protein
MNVPGSVIKAWDEGIAQLSLGGTRFLPFATHFFYFLNLPHRNGHHQVL